MTVSRATAVPALKAAGYRPHALHGAEAVWLEKNCYIDVWIELVHALGLEPLAMLGFTLAVDFEGDQWTFFKPPHDELRDLYGIDVQELTVWRPLIEHALEHLAAGKLIGTEADAFWLPDTAGTDYRNNHVKTTILLADVDLDARRLGYFHNGGYFELDGEDFTRLFRLDVGPDPSFLPLYAELIHVDRLQRLAPDVLAARSFDLLRRHLARRPARNPVRRFGDSFAQELPQLQARGLPHYHAWAFAAIRQAGAAYDLAAAHLRWHAPRGGGELQSALTAAAECFDLISQGHKALILKGARAVNSGRPFDAAPMFADMAGAWDRGMGLLAEVALQPA